MSQIVSLNSLILSLPPSCIELWPSNTEYAVLGTYHLEKSAGDVEEGNGGGETGANEKNDDQGAKKNPQQRSGSIILIQIYGDTITPIQTHPTPSAIFDLHFHLQDPSILALATSTGTIDIYRLAYSTISASQHPSPTAPVLTQVRSVRVCPEDVMVTSFSWIPGGSTMTVTLSTGEVGVRKFSFDGKEDETAEASLRSHSLEAWITAFLSDGSMLYSGGDDSALICYGLSDSDPERLETNWVKGNAAVQWEDRKTHGAGVTAILPLPTNSDRILLLTGSYDDCIRLISAPRYGRRSVLAEGNLGGGVWRLKLLQCDANCTEVLVLASCMYAGARIVKFLLDEKGEWRFEVVAKFEEHKSMNYASECLPGVDEEGRRKFITTSFYDRLLCLWRF